MVLREKLMQPKWLALWLPLHLQRLLFMIEIQIGNALLVLLVMQEFHLTQTSSVYLSEKFYLWMGVNPSHSIGLLQVTISERLVISMARSSPKLSYEPLFTGVEDVDITGKRNGLWERRIKAKIVAAAASGKDLEETGSEDDGLLDQSEDNGLLLSFVRLDYKIFKIITCMQPRINLYISVVISSIEKFEVIKMSRKSCKGQIVFSILHLMECRGKKCSSMAELIR